MSGQNDEMWSFQQVHTFNNAEHSKCDLILKDLDDDKRYDIVFCNDCKMTIGQIHHAVMGHKTSKRRR
jgi:hypothetical protein